MKPFRLSTPNEEYYIVAQHQDDVAYWFKKESGADVPTAKVQNLSNEESSNYTTDENLLNNRPNNELPYPEEGDEVFVFGESEKEDLMKKYGITIDDDGDYVYYDDASTSWYQIDIEGLDKDLLSLYRDTLVEEACDAYSVWCSYTMHKVVRYDD